MIATTTQEVLDIVNKSFDFEVNRKQLVGPEGQKTGHWGLFRSDNGACVGSAVSDRYEPHTRDDVLAMTEAAAGAFDGSRMVVSASFDHGHNVIVGPTNDYRLEVAQNDGLFPRFVLRAGYDSRCFDSLFGAFRDQCTNLQMLAPASVAHESLRHTNQLRDNMPEMISMFRSAADNWEEAGKAAQAMRRRQIDLKSFITTIYPEPEETTKRTRNTYDNRVEMIMQRIARERLATNNPSTDWANVSAWEAYQGVQGYVQHDQRRQGKPDRLQRALLSLRSDKVQMALELATAV